MYYFKSWTEITVLVSVITTVALTVIYNDLPLLPTPYFLHAKQAPWQVIFGNF